jgi:hypothetical protein
MVSHLEFSRISWPLVGRYNPSPLPATTVVTGRYYEEYRSCATNLRVLLKMSLHSQNVTNKMLLLSVYFNKTLYMFQAVPPPIIRSSNCTYGFWYLSNLAATCCCHGWDGTAVTEAVCTVWAPDDGRRNRLKHVEHFIEINKLRSIASCCTLEIQGVSRL